MIWKFINTGFHPGAYNMDFDEQLARQFNEGDKIPILRVYGWKPAAISLGFNQNSGDFDAEKTSSSGIDIVRRPTGGRAIFHAHELTYSVVIESTTEGPRTIYEFINRALLLGLRNLGITAQLSGTGEDFRKHYQSKTSIPCFSSSAKSEIQYQGRKLVGSAQRRFDRVILQHGSFLLGPQHRKIADFITDPSKSIHELLEDALTSRTTEAETILGRPVPFDEAVVAIRKGFEEKLGIVFEEVHGRDVDKLFPVRSIEYAEK